MYKIDLYTSFKDIQPLWLDMQKNASMYAFQTFEWQYTWYSNAGEQLGITPYLLVVSELEESRPFMILPLGVKNKFGLKMLVWLGGDLTDYMAPIVLENVGLKIGALLDDIIKLVPGIDLILLEKQPEFIENIKNPFIFEDCVAYEMAYFLQPDLPWEEYYKERIKKKIKSDTTRQEKRLKERGTLCFNVGSKGESAASEITKAMLAQKEYRYRQTNAQNVLSLSGNKDFYIKIAREYASDKFLDNEFCVHTSALKFNDDIVTTHFGLLFRNRFYYLMPSYVGDSELSKYSLGRILLLHLLHLSFDNNVKVFDFTIGGEEYKQDWCNKSMGLYYFIRPLNIAGFIFTLFYKLVKHIRRNKILLFIAQRILRSLRYVRNILG